MTHTETTAGRATAELALRWLCVALAAALSVPALRLMSKIWERSEYLGHGYLIPLVAAFLMYNEKDAISKAFREGTPGAFGFIWVFFGGLVEMLAIFGDVVFAAGVGIPFMLAGVVYAIGGRDLLKPMLLPLGFLIMMVPPPGFVINRVLFDLKLAVTKISVLILQGAGVSVHASGNQLEVPGHTLFVADACSGLTSIVTLLPLAVVVAYFLSHGIWRRAAIIASVIPLAVGANIIRVVVTVTVVSSQGIEFAQGILHESFGLATYIVGTMALIGVAKVLK